MQPSEKKNANEAATNKQQQKLITCEDIPFSLNRLIGSRMSDFQVSGFNGVDNLLTGLTRVLEFTFVPICPYIIHDSGVQWLMMVCTKMYRNNNQCYVQK